MGSHNVTGAGGLARRRLGIIHIFFFTVAASAPMTVLGGGVTTTYAVTGVVGVPLSFLVIAVALALFAVGYAAMSRYVSNAGAFYAYLANGLGRAWGVSASFVALLAYNAIQIGLYGLFGVAFGDLMKQKLGVDLPWWAWGLMALVVVGALGVLRVDLNASVLAVLLIAECAAVVVFDVGAFAHPDGGSISAAGLQPGNLFVGGIGGGVGGALAFAVAAFVGFESGAIYSEECRNPRRTIALATYAALAFTGLLYAASSWAMSVGAGPDKVVAAAREQGPGLLFGMIGQYWGAVVADVANVLFITSLFAALLSFHNGVARYLFALGRERVLPNMLGRTGVRSGAPVAGSLAQSVLAAVTVAVFVLAHRDPVLELFTWLSSMAAIGVLLLMAGTSMAVIGFFRGRPSMENGWQRVVAPVLATLSLAGAIFLTVYNFDSLLGTAADSPLRWVLPALLLVAAVLGLAWGLIIRSVRPEVYASIGRGVHQPFDESDVESSPIPVVA